jgi:hypothetical protein
VSASDCVHVLVILVAFAGGSEGATVAEHQNNDTNQERTVRGESSPCPVRLPLAASSSLTRQRLADSDLRSDRPRTGGDSVEPE